VDLASRYRPLADCSTIAGLTDRDRLSQLHLAVLGD
jgi:hypothetical protein